MPPYRQAPGPRKVARKSKEEAMTSAPARYDLLLKGGNLLDPAQGIDGRRDVAFQGGKVAAVAERIDPQDAASVVDVSGKLVTPGLIDLHGHFYHGGTGSAVHADQACLSAGTTTGLDAGSSGFLNYSAMRDYVFPAHRTRLLALLHIGAVGLAANRVLGGGLHDMRVIDADETADAIKANPGFLFGVKVRMHYDAVARWNAHEAMSKAREAADKSGTRLMVHVSGTPIPLPDVLEFLGPGDISTHAFNGHPEHMLDRNNKIRPEVRAAADRGVIMDVAHAGIHCDVDVVKAAMEQGLPPDTISNRHSHRSAGPHRLPDERPAQQVPRVGHVAERCGDGGNEPSGRGAGPAGQHWLPGAGDGRGCGGVRDAGGDGSCGTTWPGTT